MGKLAAIVLCAAAALALAVSQAFVIHDVVLARHAGWPVWASWSMALGFELAIAAGVLATALTGYDRRLIVADAGLIGMSVAVAAGYASALVLVPLQYAAVIVAAHRLHLHYREPVNRQPVTPSPDRSSTPILRARPSAPSADDWRARVKAGEVDHIETKAAAAEAVGVHPSTFGRAFERNGRGWVAA